MSEQELREGLRMAVAGEPALAFDPDVLLARAKQEIRRRRALFGAGAATAAVAVAAVAVPTLLGSPRGGGNQAGYGAGWPGEQCASDQAPSPQPPDITVPAQPGISYKLKVTEPSKAPSILVTPEPTGSAMPTPSAPPAPTGKPCQLSGKPSSPVPPPSSSVPPADFPWPPPGVTAKAYTAAELKDRGAAMRTHLTALFAKVVPGATGVAADEFGGEATGSVADGQTYLETFVHYTVDKVRSAVDISVYAPGAGASPAEACAEGKCSVREEKDGTRIVITEIAVENKAMILSVSHYRADGTVVRATGYNYDPTVGDGSAEPSAMRIGVEQLMALATDPELSL
jgi:hypothetical protein